MKKIFFAATICIAGLASANNVSKNHIENQPTLVENKEPEKETESEKPLKQLCTSITIVIMCDTSQNFNNSYCWEEGSQSSFNEAIHCYETEYQMFNDELCN